MASPRPEIEQKLSALIPRVRALRVARGACRLTAIALGTIAAILFLDAALALPAWSRGLCFSVWVVGFGVLAWRWVLVPWRGEISLAEVAAELEKRLPELGGRMRTAVAEEKSDSPSAIQAALDEDTARRAKAINLLTLFPTKQVTALVTVAVVPILAVAAMVPFVPGSGERLRRVALPWSRTNGRVVFHVSTGELDVKRGDPVTVSGYTKQETGKLVPTEGALCYRDGPSAAENRERLIFEGTAFHATLPSVMSDFEYCVEIGGTRSEWFRVTAYDAVELTDGTQIEIVPPVYMKRQNHIVATFADLEAMQFSTVEFRLKFNRPAAFAQLDWRPEGAPTAEIIPLALAPDQLSATASFRMRQNGVLKLLLDSESKGKKPRTETPAAVRVIPDAAPWFEQVTGVVACPRTARATDQLRIEFTARDDSAVSDAVLEYLLDSNAVQIPIQLTEKGSPAQATGVLDFPLADKFATSGTIRFRIRVRDNRNVDDPKLTPQEVVYPPSGWSELKLSAAAPPLEQQDVICHRNALRDGLTLASADVNDSLENWGVILRETNDRESLDDNHRVRLNQLREKLRNISAGLNDAARVASLTPELRPLANAVREVAEQSLKQAIEALQIADADNPAVRKPALDAANAKLNEAKSKLSELLTRNARFAQDRLDRLKLMALAADQNALANAVKARGNYLAKQRELLARLEAIVAESDPLRTAVEVAKGAEVHRLALSARRLADTLHIMNGEAKQTATDARDSLVAVIEKDQNALAKQTATIFAKLEIPCRLAGVPLPSQKDFLRVAELAADGKTVEALAELEKHAQALDRIAVTFDEWFADRSDPKFTAKQLAIWQDDLLSRFLAATKAGGFVALPPGVKNAFLTEQKAIDAALKSLPLPPDTTVKDARDDAAKHTRMVATTLADDGNGTDTAMSLAVKSLSILSERTPTVAKRKGDSLRVLESIRQDLRSLGDAEQAIKGFETRSPDVIAKKLAPFISLQGKLNTSAAALDLPGLPERQARVLAAFKASINDMQDGSVYDVQTSQAWLRRELERLKWILDGTPSPDAKAEELYRKLAALADSLDAHGPNLNAKHLELAAQVLQSVSVQLSLIVVPEAPALLNDARVALQIAEAGLRDGKPDEVRRRIRAAADSLGILADRLNGFESDLERIQRLSALRRFACEKPKEINFSDEAWRQLGREMEELSATRVGPGAQTLKRRALDLYAKLRAKNDPGRLDVGTDLKTLATTLDEIAAKMADLADLATVPPRSTPPSAPLEADNFLPSKSLADATRTLAKQQRALHAQVTNLAADLASRLRPTLGTSSGRVILWQIAKADALTRDVDEFLAMLEIAARTFAPNDAIVQAITEAANDASKARRRLADAASKAADANAAEAEKLRLAAETLLRNANEKLAAVAPPGAAPAIGDSLRAAERAMRKAIQHLAPNGSASAAEKAMRDAANAIVEAEKNVGK